MNEQQAAHKKPGRKKSLSTREQISELEKMLADLRQRAKQEDKEKEDHNRKAVCDLLRAERLDQVSLEVWRDVVPELKLLLEKGGGKIGSTREETAVS